METLTLKELAPYLPYEIMMRSWTNHNHIFKLLSIDINYDVDLLPINESKWDGENHIETNLYYKGVIQFKPILYPLDYLTKPITHNGETFVPIERLNELFGYEITFDDMYLPIQKLFEWRFDVFNLINRGLAIPITETFNTYI